MRLRALAVVFVLLCACDMPRDPEGTLHRVTEGTLRVGATTNDPWVSYEGGEPVGIEVELVKQLAWRLHDLVITPVKRLDGLE